MTIPFYIIDVFTEKKYAGNQLAVFLNAADLTTDQMQQIAREINFAESTFVTVTAAEDNKATIRIFTPAHEMRFAGHPIIGTSWVLMNKVFKHQPNEIELKVPIGEIRVRQAKDLVWLKAAQPDFLDIFIKEDFETFSNLKVSDFDNRFVVQEVTTGSAFIMVPLKEKCKTEHKALYFFSLEDEMLSSRMLCLENNQLIEDAATGSASTCLQAFLLKYHSTEIKMVNNQGEYINRNSQIYFDGKREENLFDINIGGQTQFVAQGEWEVV